LDVLRWRNAIGFLRFLCVCWKVLGGLCALFATTKPQWAHGYLLQTQHVFEQDDMTRYGSESLADGIVPFGFPTLND
jgi:hypothetical protein